MEGDAQDQLAVVEQQPRTRFDCGEDFLVRQLDTGRVAGRRIAVEDEGAAGLQHDLALGELADAQLRALKIGQDGGRAAEPFFQAADRLDQRDLRLLIAMAHIDPEGIGARLEQGGDRLGIAAGRAERGEDADFARTRGEGLGHVHILLLCGQCPKA